MNNKADHLAIIPARSGSKGVRDKNIRMLDGIPLMAWSIKTAAASGLFSRIVVSTDDERYAAIARSWGGEVPWLRTRDLATDQTPSGEVILDMLDRFDAQGESFSHVTLLQPTSPLRSAGDIRAGWNLLQSTGADAVIGVTPCEHPPQWSNALPEDHSMHHFINPEARVARQELPVQYRINGALYMASSSTFRSYGHFLTPGSIALVMPRERSVDIDEELDFLIAEAIINQHNFREPWNY
jgi:CMP-N,N'-diacetyllegionaminic acid synthase